MKKRNIVILLTIIIALPLIAVACAFMINNYNQTLNFEPKENSVTNYNNYVTSNYIDYRNGQFVYTARTLLGITGTIVDANGNVNKVHGVGKQIQLTDDRVAFLSNGALFVSKERKNCVAQNVDSFIVIENGILYSKISNSYERTLYWYNIETETSKAVAQNIIAYCVDEEKLIVLNDDGWLTLYSATSVEKKTKLDINSYPFVLMLQNKCVLYKTLNKLCILNLDTAEMKEIIMSESEYANNHISFICDNDCIFYSFQATRTDGSVVIDDDSTNNGVWSIDAATLEKHKLCDETFGKLYLWGDTLIGENEKGLYQISMINGEQVKIIK